MHPDRRLKAIALRRVALDLRIEQLRARRRDLARGREHSLPAERLQLSRQAAELAARHADIWRALARRHLDAALSNAAQAHDMAASRLDRLAEPERARLHRSQAVADRGRRLKS